MALTPGDTNYQNYVNRICYTKTQLDSGVLDSRYYAESEFIATSAGVGSAGLPVKLNSSGLIDATMIVGGSVATHAALTAAHGATGAVVGTTNTQTLTNKTLTSPTASDANLTGTTTLALANFYLAALAGTDPLINLDSNDYLLYTRSSNTLDIAIASTARLSVTSSAVTVTGNAVVSGSITAGGVAVPTISSTSTLTNKTLTAPTIGDFSNANHTHIGSGTYGGVIAHSVLSGAGTYAHSLVDAHIDATAAHGATGAVVGTTNAQTLTNKTLTTPIISTISNTGTLTLPTSTDTLVGRATTDTLTNKTLTTPTVKGDTTQLTISGSTNTNKQLLLAYDVSADIGIVQAVLQGTGAKPLTLNYAGGGVIVGGTTLDHAFEVQNTASHNYRMTVNLNSSGTNYINSYSSAKGTFTGAPLALFGSRVSIKQAVFNIDTGNAPASASAAGVAGDFAWASGFLYICTAANTWQRVAVATF